MLKNFFPKIADSLALDSKFKTTSEPYLQALISITAGLLGNLVKDKQDLIYPNLYTVLLGESGRGKSTYQSKLMNMLVDIESYKTELSKKEQAKKKEKKENKKDLSTEPLSVEVNDDNPFDFTEKEGISESDKYPEGVFYYRYPLFNSDSTIEAMLEEAAKVTNGNMFLAMDELRALFDNFKKAGREGDQSFFNANYQADKLYRVNRKGKDAKIPDVLNPVVNLKGTTTIDLYKDVLARYIKEKRFDGLPSRFQNIMILPPKVKGANVFKGEDEIIPFDEALEKSLKKFWEAIINQRFKVAKQLKYREDNPDKLTDEELHKDFIVYIDKNTEAKRLHREFSINLDKLSFKTDLMRNHICRASDFATKVALIFHIAESFSLGLDPFSRSETNLVNELEMQAAINYVNKCLAYAADIYGENVEINADSVKSSEEILDYIANKNGTFFKKNKDKLWTARMLGRTEVKYLPRTEKGSVDMTRLGQLLDHLVERGEIYSKEIEHNNVFVTVKYSFYPIPEEVDEQKEENESSLGRDYNGISSLKAQKIYPTKDENRAHIEDLKKSVNLYDYASRLTKLNGAGIGKCPFHDDKIASFSVNRFKGVFYCHSAACGAKGTVIDFIMLERHLSLPEAIKFLEDLAGKKIMPKTEYFTPAPETSLRKEEDIVKKLKFETQKEIIFSKADIKGTPPYLAGRIATCGDKDLSGARELISKISEDSIRYIKELPYFHEDGDREFKAVMPAMLAKIVDSENNWIGIHRTYLNEYLSRKAQIPFNFSVKKIRGKVTGGFVNLIKETDTKSIIIGEGIETVLSLHLLLSNFTGCNFSSVATLTANNIPPLSEHYENIIIAVDNDKSGYEFADKCEGFYDNRFMVSKMYPDKEFNDWNDQLLKKGSF